MPWNDNATAGCPGIIQTTLSCAERIRFARTMASTFLKQLYVHALLNRRNFDQYSNLTFFRNSMPEFLHGLGQFGWNVEVDSSHAASPAAWTVKECKLQAWDNNASNTPCLHRLAPSAFCTTTLFTCVAIESINDR